MDNCCREPGQVDSQTHSQIATNPIESTNLAALLTVTNSSKPTQHLPITVIIGVKNEAANLPKCLDALKRFERVVVVDSHSSDSTPDIARAHGVEVLDFSYQGGYPKKRQWALNNLDIQTPWVMLLDADEVIPTELFEEIKTRILKRPLPAGFLITKGFHFMGSRMANGGFSHAAVLLFQTGKARFEHLLDEPGDALDMEVHERLIVDGQVDAISTPLIHEDYKGLEAYIDRHNKYSTWEAKVRTRFLTTGEWGESAISPKLFGNTQERRRYLKKIAMRVPIEPWLWFFYHFVLRLGFLEGRRGFIASQIRAQYIANVRSKMWEMRNNSRKVENATPALQRK